MSVTTSGHGKPLGRPLGLILVVGLFVAFAVADMVSLLLAGGSGWIISLSMSALLMFLFRKLWFGDEPERKIAVFFGFFVAILNGFAVPELPLNEWSRDDYLTLCEAAALYLIYAKRDPFFRSAA